MKTVHIVDDYPTDADRMWRAVQHPTAFLYVCRGLFGIPALSGRTEPLREGESGTGWLWVFHVVPAYRHTIAIVDVDQDTRTVRTNESGGVLRAWNHTLHVEPLGEHTSRYSDTIEIDAGPLTSVAALIARGLFTYRHRRWRKLVRKHLLPEGPAFAKRPAARI